MANKYKKQQLKIQPISYIILGGVLLIVILLIIFGIPKGPKAVANRYNTAIQKFTTSEAGSGAQINYLNPNKCFLTTISADSLIKKIKAGDPVLFVIGGTYSENVLGNIGDINKYFDTSLDVKDPFNKERTLSTKYKTLYLVEVKTDEKAIEVLTKLNDELADIEGYKKIADSQKSLPFLAAFNDGKFVNSILRVTGDDLKLRLKHLYEQFLDSITAVK